MGFAALLSLASLGKPIHMDEPLFLAPARQILKTPLRPFDFTFNWYGRDVPMASINNTPPLMLYALAAALKVSGGREELMRLLFVPVEVLAAGALYGLAAVFLAEPLWPALIVLACPGWALNMTLLYPEKLATALGLLGLYLLALTLEKKERWFWWSAGLCGLAVFAKYGFVFLVPAAAWYLRRRSAAPQRIAVWCAAALVPIAAYLIFDHFAYRSAVGSVWTAMSEGFRLPTSAWSHKLRALLSFTGGCGVATAIWPLALLSDRHRTFWVLLAAAAVLFFPALDLAPLVRGLDRATGIVLAFGAALGFHLVLSRYKNSRGGVLWAGWAASVAAVQLLLYWSVIARVVVLLVPPLVFALAEVLETRLSPRALRGLYAGTFVVSLLLTGSLAWVDWTYAAAQRDVAAQARALYPDRRLWCAGHWGLQYYMEQAGARELDSSRGGWDETAPGDVVVVPKVNSNVLRSNGKVRAIVRSMTVAAPLPLRLISGFSGEGGFYASTTGFLPFSFSGEPLDSFDIVELR